MNYEAIASKFVATAEKGEVSSLLIRPDDARWLLVLGHGASTNMRHRTLQTIAERLADVGVATFRYNFPYMERGGGGRDSQAVSLATVRSAVAAAYRAAGDLSLLVGGHSFGGRMSSLAAAEAPLEHVRGLVFFAFPLHPAGKPGTERADHLSKVTVPMLFLSGTRDELADLDLLRPVCGRLGDRATLHLFDTADHGFKTLKRAYKSDDEVFVEMARVISDWTSKFPMIAKSGQSTRSDEKIVRLRIVCVKPPNPAEYNAEFGLQDNSSREWVVHPGRLQPDGSFIFECELGVKPNQRTKGPNFFGPYAFGSPGKRFLYLSWRHTQPDGSGYARRMKIHLSSITWEQIEEAERLQHGALEVMVPGTAKDGGLTCGGPYDGKSWRDFQSEGWVVREIPS